jgi:hypothetical protein
MEYRKSLEDVKRALSEDNGGRDDSKVTKDSAGVKLKRALRLLDEVSSS